MKKIKIPFLVILFTLLPIFATANNEQPQGIDLGEYAFGIPADQLNFNNQSPFTLSFWINIKELNHSENGTQFINIRNPNYNAAYNKGGGYPFCDWGYLFSTIQEYGVDDLGKVWKDNELLINVREDGASQSTPFTREKTYHFVPNDWVYVTFQSYYTSKPEMELYINGEPTLKFKTMFSSPRTLHSWHNEYIIMIGGPAYNRSPLNAYIDKVQLYNKTLSQAEIIESMTAPLLNDASLLGYWDFEDGCTTDADGFMFADKGSIKSAIYKILTSSNISVGTEIQPFVFGMGVDSESVIQGTEENNIAESNAKAFISNETLIIENAEGINTVVVYDAMGKVIASANVNGATSTQIALPSTIKGVLIVKVNNEVVKVVK